MSKEKSASWKEKKVNDENMSKFIWKFNKTLVSSVSGGWENVKLKHKIIIEVKCSAYSFPE